MKKVISLLLVLVMALGILAGCGKTSNTDGGNEDPKTNVPASALEILENTYAKYEESEKFSIAGGAGDNINWEGPAAIDMAVNGADLSYIVYVPEAEVANLTDAATMQHAMNANTFSCGVLRVKDGVDVKTFAQTMRDAIQGTQWMCGFPEKLIVVTIGGEYVVVAFGHDNADAPLISTFYKHLTAAYPDALTLYTEAIG